MLKFCLQAFYKFIFLIKYLFLLRDECCANIVGTESVCNQDTCICLPGKTDVDGRCMDGKYKHLLRA